ncbi:MAG: S-layer homology domain-containing protein, partial [Clostridia bacterium]|nr:S-layer homology domain-containing protein [Clostridia bacterium]
FGITISKKSSGGGGGGGSDPDPDPDPTDPSGPVTEVGDDSIDTEVTEVDGQEVADVTVDDDAIKNAIEESEEGTIVVINVDSDADVVQAGFGGDMISLMEKNDISISIKTETASYSVPAKDLNISALAKELGENVEVSDVQISIIIGQPTAEEIKVVEDQAVKAGVQLVIPPIEFNVVCTDGENSVKVSKFNRFVERSIKVPEGVDPKTITTAVVQDKKGNLTPVPTEVVKIDGAYYVRIKSMTNSVYTVINNIKQFADVANHWSKDDVNDMGSRLIINGVSDTTFEPDRDITRAEFMTIVVRALGIMRSGEGVDAFDDVKADAWYYDAVSIAKDYGLTNGNGDGTFAPNSKITREEAMAIIARAMKMAGMDTAVDANEISTVLGTFVDNGDVSEWAKESVSACVKNGIVSGYAGKISAKNNITRAECAAIVKRMLVKADLID